MGEKYFWAGWKYATDLYMDGAKTMKFRLFLGLSILLLVGFSTYFVMSYSRVLASAEIPGNYAFKLGTVEEKITLLADGIYTNALRVNDQLAWEDKGTWSHDKIGNQSGITFAKFRFGVQGYSSRPSYWFVTPEKTIMGKKKLCFDPDLDRCFSGP
jgi:hypothetical protein